MSEQIVYPVRGKLPRLEPQRGDDPHRLVGQDQSLQRLVDYVAENGEGRFLVSGFAGVGKSSFVAQAISRIRQSLASDSSAGPGRPIVVVELSAQSLTDPAVVGKRLIWHLRWEVSEGRVHMRDAARDRLIEAFDGVAASSRESSTETRREVSAGAEVDSLAKLGVNATRSDLKQVKSVYVPYDLQTSLLELGPLLLGIKTYRANGPFRFLTKWFPFLAPREPAPLPVVVIDRIGEYAVFKELGNLFNARGVVFLVVAPPQVRAEWQGRRDLGHEDLPSFQDLYLSCLWDEMPELLSNCLDLSAVDSSSRQTYDRFVGFLTFVSGGVPRQCLEILFRHQVIENGARFVRFDARDIETINFFDMVYRILVRREEDFLGEFVASLSEADGDLARRFALLHARDVIARGTTATRQHGESTIQVANTLRPPDAEMIASALVRVLREEGVLTEAEGAFALSPGARTHVAHGRAILGTGILPRPVLPEESTRIIKPGPPRPQPRPVVDEDAWAATVASPPTAAPSPSFGKTRFQSASLIGRVIDERYQISELIGQGGMGEVYLAEHLRLKRRCAVKVMHPQLIGDPDSVSRFNREATNASRVNHPNIASIYDFGETSDGIVYLAMEYIEGNSLADIIRQEPRLPLNRTMYIGVQIANALHAAQEMGVVHRDLKPQNVLMTKDAYGREVAKVVDFGIARLMDTSDSVTRTGFVVGTPAYMSPEQMMGDSVDYRTDLYSFGCILFEMLTGSRPFGSDTHLNFRRMTEEPPRVRDFLPTVPPQIDALVTRLMARDPAQRTITASGVAEVLTKALTHEIEL